MIYFLNYHSLRPGKVHCHWPMCCSTMICCFCHFCLFVQPSNHLSICHHCQSFMKQVLWNVTLMLFDYVKFFWWDQIDMKTKLKKCIEILSACDREGTDKYAVLQWSRYRMGWDTLVRFLNLLLYRRTRLGIYYRPIGWKKGVTFLAKCFRN